MTPLADLMRLMAADGCSIETITKAVEAAELHDSKRHEASPGASRMRRYRERHKASQSVTNVTSDVTCDSLLSLEEDINIKKKGRASQRGVRLSPDWQPSPETREAMLKKCGVDFNDMQPILERFRDYWIALPGQKGCKLDWDATLRNWIRKDCEKNAPAAVSSEERYKRAVEAYRSGGPLNGASR